MVLPIHRVNIMSLRPDITSEEDIPGYYETLGQWTGVETVSHQLEPENCSLRLEEKKELRNNVY